MLSVLENPLRFLKRCNCLKELKQVHAQVFLHALNQDNYVAVKLVSFCSKTLQDVEYARAIFDSLVSSANIFLWTAMIASYSCNHSNISRESILIYKKLHQNGKDGPFPNEFTLSSVLKACSLLEAKEEGIQIHTNAVKCGLDSSFYVQATLLDMYSKFGWVRAVRDLFENVSSQNVVACNTMLTFYFEAGDIESAQLVFNSMHPRDSITWTIMISGYAGQGNMVAAKNLFDMIPMRETKFWNSLIAGYTLNGEWCEAIKLFLNMRSEGANVNHVTMSALTSACGHLGSVKLSIQVHGFLEKGCIEMNRHVLNSLVDMYTKCSCIYDAHQLFQAMQIKDVISYNIMIGGFAYNGCVEECIKLFTEMIEVRIQADAATYLGVLTAFSHAGLLKSGCKFLLNMSRDYGFEPTVDHFACIVDLLGRSGFIGEAYELLKNMPVEPHAGVFGALLNASRTYCDVHVGNIAATELFRIERSNPGNYVILSNILARANFWDGVIGVRHLMRARGVEKTPGCSWIEVDGKFPELVMADASLSLNIGVYDVLRSLYIHLI